MKKIIKLAGIEFFESEITEIYNKNQYICSNKGIFQVLFSTAQNKFTSQKIASAKLASGNRFYLLSGKAINEITGQNLIAN